MTTPPAPARPAAPARSAWRTWFPHPVLSLLLGLTWLLLAHSVAVVHWLAAVVLGWGVPRLLAPYLSPSSRLHWPSAVRLMFVVLWDIVVANVTVARLTLGSMQRPQPAWLRVPLATDHPRVNALFASIITMTPGTVSAVIDESRRLLFVHALNCDDAPAMVQDMKTRYEAPLCRVFRVEPTTTTASQGSSQ
ncbi:Na+/H+ antiporter subunit E [Tepidimonas charontis]|uniref:Na(+)/H(+) antiporter subunit E n=1 Tax=Tepidimonas charontis TaxID=2267262 RepID=A0A554XFB6_9BURK|nr:Na+/H+ antiporter subunit E [Tepidimonas charontis]TSE34494.1 Na(+)/H(+) antiporter subunit E [Tepidimonas charontis]